MQKVTIILVLAVAAGVSQSAMSFQSRLVEDAGVPEGYICQDILVTTTSDWMAAALVMNLDQLGGVYQDPNGSDNPEPGLFSQFPSVEFDTYLTDGRLGAAVIIGGAVDLGGGITAQFDQDSIDVSWYTTDTDNIGELVLARITLSNQVQGTWQFLATAAPPGGPVVPDEEPYPVFAIVNGRMVPEPATLTILGAMALVLTRRRRQSR